MHFPVPFIHPPLRQERACPFDSNQHRPQGFSVHIPLLLKSSLPSCLDASGPTSVSSSRHVAHHVAHSLHVLALRHPLVLHHAAHALFHLAHLSLHLLHLSHHHAASLHPLTFHRHALFHRYIFFLLGQDRKRNE